MARTKVYEETETAADGAAQDSNGESGWEESPAAVTPIGLAKHKGRHKYEAGVCIKCGHVQGEEAPPKPGKLTRATSKGIVTPEMLISGAFFGAGILLERRPWVLESLPNPPASPVGKALQLEAAVAGKRIDKVLRGTVAYKLLTAFLDKTGPWAELVPLLAMPLVIGAASMRPDLAEKFKPILVSVMVPVLVEASKMANEQSAIMQMAEGVTSEMVEAANSLVDSLLATDEGKSE